MFQSKHVADNGSVTVGLMPSLHQVAALVQKGHMDYQIATEVTHLYNCFQKYKVVWINQFTEL